MNAIILSVGDELVLGQTIDTNSAWISQQLTSVGCDILGHATVPDQFGSIKRAIENAAGHCDFLIISGGIGPTEDDLTRQALGAFLRQPLEINESWLTHLEAFFQRLGREMPATNRIQAMIPRGARMIENTAGTAAGIDAQIWPRDAVAYPSEVRASEEYMQQMFGETELERRKAVKEFQQLTMDMREKSVQYGAKIADTRAFVMPGVPKEMKIMFERSVLPHIKEKTGGAVILSRTLHTFGLGESSVAEKLGELMKRDRNPSVGTTVANGIVSLRLNARFPSRDEAQKQLEETSTACQAALGDLIFGQDNQTLPQIIADLLNPKSAIQNPKSRTVTTAESCTGGLLAKMLTDIPGSSDYFKQAWVTYSNETKRDRLGVSENLLQVYGAVSEPVVEAMAKAARRLAKSDFALAISGIAGPTGGTAQKPVGTVCIALAHAKPGPTEPVPRADYADSQIQSRTFHFSGDREMIRDRSAKMALTMLRFHLLAKPMPF